jgi:hypothetical protein
MVQQLFMFCAKVNRNLIIRFVLFQKERIDKKEITKDSIFLLIR